MSAERISAGEAYVAITVDNSDLIAKLRETSTKVAASSKSISTAAKGLSPRISLSGVADMKKTLQEVEASTSKTAKKIGAISDRLVITAGDVWNAAKSLGSSLSNAFGAFGDKFDKMSSRTGLTASALSELAYAANMSGADIAAVEGALKHVAERLASAQNGSLEAARSFTALGLSVDSLREMNSEEQFDAIAAAIASVPDATERAGLAMKLLGESGTALLPLFSAGADGIASLRNEARRFGVSIDNETAKLGADFVDATTRVKESVRGAGMSLAREFTPILTKAANAISDISARSVELIKRFPGLSTALLGGVGGFVALAGAAVGLSQGLAALSAGFTALRAAFTATTAFAAANPFLAIAAGVAVATAAVVALSGASSSYTTSAREALEAGDASRKVDEGALTRLKELQAQHKLNSAEILEAVRLAESLRAKYGDVGVAVDAVTGKINISNDAAERLNKAVLQDRKKQLTAALMEAEANAQGDVIASKIANEDLTGWEKYSPIARRRGVGFWEDVTSWKWGGDRGLEITERDPVVQAKIRRAQADLHAKINQYRMELEALDAQLNAPPGESAEVDFARRAADAFESSDVEKPVLSDAVAEIEKKRGAAVEELQKLAETANASDSAAIASEIDRINAAARDQVAAVEKDRLTKEEEKLAAVEEERRRAAMTDAERQIDAIERETAAYIEQLDAVKALRESLGDAEGVRALDARINAARDDAADKIGKVKAATAAKEKEESTPAGVEELAESLKSFNERFGDPLTNLESAWNAAATAYGDLQTALAGGDSQSIAAAIDRLGESQQEYLDALDAADAVDKGLKSLGGSFDAWQAASSLSGAALTTSLKTAQAAQLNELKQTRGAINNNGQILGAILDEVADQNGAVFQ